MQTRNRLMHAARQARKVGFASTAMRNCLGNLPATPEKAVYQKKALENLKAFNEQEWHNDPVVTVIDGVPYTNGKTVTTVDAFGKENGKMIQSDKAGLEALKKHVASLDTSCHDYREAVRRIEDTFLAPEDGSRLIVNQTLDFKKQDGFTEIEEWTQACIVERRLNDCLLQDEKAGIVSINRAPAFSGCVSNFSNFLDLSKKVLRHVEVGVPVVVLSRSNTTQHMYRWFQRLVQLMKENNVPLHMVTYACLDVEGQRDLLRSCPQSAVHFTGSREVAEKLKEVAPNLMAATSGPNTMVCTALNENTREAVRISSTIENAGQCTHVRHLVAPNITLDDCEKIYDNTPVLQTPEDAINSGFRCDGMFASAPTTAGTDPMYTKHPSLPAAYRVGTEFPIDEKLDEKWRQAFIDCTSVESLEKLKSKEFLDSLCAWLVRNGPITVAVNGDDDIAMYIFENTSMTVYNIGSLDKPSLNVAARPQEFEAFGEFPARPTLSKYTKFPVLVPSSAASYNTEYTQQHLKSRGSTCEFPTELQPLWEASGELTRGYMAELLGYMRDACGAHNNTNNTHARTAVVGWQRPPLNNKKSIVRVAKDTTLDALCVYLLPYLSTNARDSLEISVDAGASAEARQLIKALNLSVVEETQEELDQRHLQIEAFNVLYPQYDGAAAGAPMAGIFLLLFFPVGHVKCLYKDDKEFVKKWSASKKWLSVLAA